MFSERENGFGGNLCGFLVVPLAQLGDGDPYMPVCAQARLLDFFLRSPVGRGGMMASGGRRRGLFCGLRGWFGGCVSQERFLLVLVTIPNAK